MVPLSSFPIISRRLLLAGTFLLLLAAGCSQEPSEVGVVARVNGQPIFLSQLEAKYDLSHLGWTGTVLPTLGKLKADYSRILSELIAQELIFQVLREKGFAVTEAEMLYAEAKVRADYPKGLFEQVLVEEYIDLDVWREQLRAHLAYEKLLNNILRPRISLDKEEVEAFYQNNLDMFHLPARLTFVLVTGPDKETLRQALDMYLAGSDGAALEQAFEGVRTQQVKLLQDRLTKKWRDALENVEEGQPSELLSAQNGYEALVLLERRTAQQLSPEEAFPLVEKILMEKKLQEAFASWLENELHDADIFVSQRLLSEEGEEDDAPVAPLLPEEEPGIVAPQKMDEESVTLETVTELPLPGDEQPLGDEDMQEQGVPEEEGAPPEKTSKAAE